MKTFKLPDLGEGLQEAEIVAWHVNAGDHIVVDQPLLSVETDKAIVDVPSPFAGKVLTLHAKVGDVVALDAARLALHPRPPHRAGGHPRGPAGAHVGDGGVLRAQ